jgi:hypothetical protein
MNKNYIDLIENEYPFSDTQTIYKWEDANYITEKYAELHIGDSRVLELEKALDELRNKSELQSELKAAVFRKDKSFKKSIGIIYIIPFLVTPIAFYVIYSSNDFMFIGLVLAITSGIVIFWLSMIITIYILEPLASKNREISIKGNTKEVVKLQQQYDELESNIIDEILLRKKEILTQKQDENFEIWKTSNLHKYPYDLGFYFEESYQLSFLKYIDKITSEKTANGYIDQRFAKYAQYKTILETDKILVEKGAKEYSLVYVKRSSNQEIQEGMYIYYLSKKELNLLHPPYNLYEFENKAKYLIFNSEAYQKTMSESKMINFNSIIKFELFGTELMQSSVQTNPTGQIKERDNQRKPTVLNQPQSIKKPGLLGTVISQLMFGSSYTFLKGASKMMGNLSDKLGNLEELSKETNQRLGNIEENVLKVVDAINNISIQTTHEIKDTRSVQIIFADNTDIELEGVSIYYDLNRYLADKTQREKGNTIDTKFNEEEALEKISHYKKMYDDNLIDEEEFKDMKKKILSKVE